MNPATIRRIINVAGPAYVATLALAGVTSAWSGRRELAAFAGANVVIFFVGYQLGRRS